MSLAFLAFITMVAFTATAEAATEDPKIYMEFNNFSFKPEKKNKPGMLKFSTGKVVSVLYSDGSTTDVNTDFESIVGAKIKLPKLIQSGGDPATFLDSTVSIKHGKDVFIDGILTNITFDPGADMTDGIVTLNLGFQLDNLIFNELGTDTNSRFIQEYAALSSTHAGALALTLHSAGNQAPFDSFSEKSKGHATGEFQIPEPASILLLAGGIMGLATGRRRRG